MLHNNINMTNTGNFTRLYATNDKKNLNYYSLHEAYKLRTDSLRKFIL